LVKVFWYVAIGSALGGVARFALGGFIQQRAGADFPMGTLVINITGSFLLGIFMRYAMQSNAVSPEMRLFLTTGFCGGYTTFSTFTYETARLMEDGEYGRAALYVGASVGVALAGMFLGFAVANWLIALRAQV
jgi:CrcB protein